MTNSQIIVILMIPLVVWRMYSRYQKLVGKQRIRPIKLWASTLFFPLLFILLLLLNGAHPNMLGCLILSGIAGVCLSMFGLKLTRFEFVDNQLFYTPNPYLGLALLLMLSGRIAFRFFQLIDQGDQKGPAAIQSITSNPLTMLFLGLLICYYASYSAGILRRRHKLLNKTSQAGIR